MRVLKSLVVGLCLAHNTVALSSGFSAAVETVYRLPPEFAFAQFDTIRGVLYAKRPAPAAIVVLRISDGVVLNTIPLSLSPSEMSETPDGRWLYVGECQTNQTGLATRLQPNPRARLGGPPTTWQLRWHPGTGHPLLRPTARGTLEFG